MKANSKDLKVFAVSGGDPTQFWAQGRMQGFVDTIKAAIPDAKFVTTHENGLNVSYDPGQTYDAYRTFLSANPRCSSSRTSTSAPSTPTAPSRA